MNKGPETPASRAHKAQGSPMRYSEPNEGEEEAELEKLEADKLRREVPCLPDELFDRLPDFLKRGLTHFRRSLSGGFGRFGQRKGGDAAGGNSARSHSGVLR